MAGQIYFSILNPVIVVIFGGMFLFFWLRWRAHDHLALLALAFFVSAIGFVFYDLSPLRSEPLSRLVSNAAFTTAIVLACAAALMRAGVAIPAKTFGAMIAVGFSIFCWFLFVDPSVAVRITVIGLVFGGLTGLTAIRLAQAGPRSTADRLLVVAAVIGAHLSLGRPVLALVGILDPADASSFQQSTYGLTLQAFSPILTGTVAILFLAAMTMDTVDQLRAEANHDYLTGLLNRRGFEAAINRTLILNGDAGAALLVADIDDFKQINDRFGHKTGDQVIAAVAKVLLDHGKAKFAARVGGEEYALFYQHGDYSALHRHAEAIRMAMRQLVISGLPETHKLTLSIGLHGRRQGETLSEMLTEADRALYKAKANGKDRAVASRLTLRPVARLA
ncbi:MAG: hypothetical protein ABS75_02185 [Pelagibacterium sp. SCN 63-23]|nr:MAG: hypothetical protein ABS75_02185 [Pelagibacterium sp. SCN 63-23]